MSGGTLTLGPALPWEEMPGLTGAVGQMGRLQVRAVRGQDTPAWHTAAPGGGTGTVGLPGSPTASLQRDLPIGKSHRKNAWRSQQSETATTKHECSWIWLLGVWGRECPIEPFLMGFGGEEQELLLQEGLSQWKESVPIPPPYKPLLPQEDLPLPRSALSLTQGQFPGSSGRNLRSHACQTGPGKTSKCFLRILESLLCLHSGKCSTLASPRAGDTSLAQKHPHLFG